MTALESIIYRLIVRLHGQAQRAVKTLQIAVRLGKDDRVIRRVLVRMEAAGLIRRRGKRGGWLPVTVQS